MVGGGMMAGGMMGGGDGMGGGNNSNWCGSNNKLQNTLGIPPPKFLIYRNIQPYKYDDIILLPHKTIYYIRVPTPQYYN